MSQRRHAGLAARIALGAAFAVTGASAAAPAYAAAPSSAAAAHAASLTRDISYWQWGYNDGYLAGLVEARLECVGGNPADSRNLRSGNRLYRTGWAAGYAVGWRQGIARWCHGVPR